MQTPQLYLVRSLDGYQGRSTIIVAVLIQERSVSFDLAKPGLSSDNSELPRLSLSGNNISSRSSSDEAFGE